jgi:hypothetical protein
MCCQWTSTYIFLIWLGCIHLLKSETTDVLILMVPWLWTCIASLQFIRGRTWIFSVCNCNNIKWSWRDTKIPRHCCWCQVIILFFLPFSVDNWTWTWFIHVCVFSCGYQIWKFGIAARASLSLIVSFWGRSSDTSH